MLNGPLSCSLRPVDESREERRSAESEMGEEEESQFRPPPFFRASTVHRIRSPSSTIEQRATTRGSGAPVTLDPSRQSWVSGEGGASVGRVIPLYMLCLDLVFAAAFSVSSRWIEHGGADAVQSYFMLYFAIVWQWDHLNRLFNRFDTEDLLSELVVVLSMACMMVLALNTRGCFFPIADDEHVRLSRCRYVVSSLIVQRLLLLAFTLWIGWHVRAARKLLWREGALWLLSAPAGGIILSGFAAAPAQQALLFAFSFALADLVISTADDLLPRSKITKALDTGLPFDTGYTISRYERMVIVAIGSVCADSIRVALANWNGIEWRSLAIGIATPWYVFLMKVYYFDLSNYHGSDAGAHATSISRRRALCWALAHLPLLGCLLWVAIAISSLLGCERESPESCRPYWELCASFTAYAAICSLQQCMHGGIGRGRRRCGRRMRLCVRACGLVGLCAAQPLLGLAARAHEANAVAAAVGVVNTVWLTVMAAAEVWGRNVRDGAVIGNANGARGQL